MSTNNHVKKQRRQLGAVRALSRIRHSAGAMTPPSQQAIDSIVNTPEFPRY